MKLKTLGLLLTIAGAGIGVASSVVGSKQQDQAISEAVKKEVAKQTSK